MRPITRDLMVMGGVIAYLAALLVVDVAVWPGHNLPILYAVPIVAMAQTRPVRLVLSVVVLSILFDLVGVWIERVPPVLWPATLTALLVIGYVSTLVALRREEQIRRIRRQEEMIRTAEDMRQPLTVILGNAQLLRRKGDLPEETGRRLATIESATHRLRDLVGRLLA